MSFVQLFGSSLQLTPHLRVLLPEGVWGDEAFVELPPPKDEDVEAGVHRLVRQLARAFEDEEAGWPRRRAGGLTAPRVQERLSLPTSTQAKRRLQLVAPVTVAPRQAAAPLKSPALEASGLAAHRRPRLDWATFQHRAWAVDVWTCRCGGQRQVLSVVTSRRTAPEMLLNMGLLAPHSPAPSAQAPPERELVLSV